MPVIACPDCGRDVSTVAPVCPHCGRPSPAGTTPIAAGSVPPQPAEQTLWRGNPSAMKLTGRVIIDLVIIAVLVAIFRASMAASATPETRAMLWTIMWWIVSVFALVELIRFCISFAQLRSTQYTVTNQRVMIEKGLLSKSLSEIDLRYVDDTQFVQSVFDRMLGIGNVTIVSSDKTIPIYVFAGVPDPRGLRELIRTSAYQVSQRQIFTRAT
jgi:membrane protein YdbS with pleckstrin-like domain